MISVRGGSCDLYCSSTQQRLQYTFISCNALDLVKRCCDVVVIGKHLPCPNFTAAKFKTIHRLALHSKPNHTNKEKKNGKSNNPIDNGERGRDRDQ